MRLEKAKQTTFSDRKEMEAFKLLSYVLQQCERSDKVEYLVRSQLLDLESYCIFNSFLYFRLSRFSTPLSGEISSFYSLNFIRLLRVVFSSQLLRE